MRLSAIIITRNEAANIAACLATLKFCDEIIVVDSNSSDDTRDIAAAHGARVSIHPFNGFGAQKNVALSQASGDWVFSIDADERVPPALAQEILATVAAGAADGFEIPRLSSFLGREMRPAPGFTDYVLRLFRRGRGRFSADLVHERVICDGPVSRLSQPLTHHAVNRLEDVLSRIDRYSTAGAKMMVASGRRVPFWRGIAHGSFAFIRSYLLQFGFRHGREGFLQAVANAEGTYYRYMKAWIATRRR